MYIYPLSAPLPHLSNLITFCSPSLPPHWSPPSSLPVPCTFQLNAFAARLSICLEYCCSRCPFSCRGSSLTCFCSSRLRSSAILPTSLPRYPHWKSICLISSFCPFPIHYHFLSSNFRHSIPQSPSGQDCLIVSVPKHCILYVVGFYLMNK